MDWIKVLHLASLFGFDPANLEDDEPITAEEIGAIALAVEESLDDIPNHNASGGKKAHQMSPLEWFSGARKEKEAREEKVDEVEEYPDSARIGFTGADGIRLTSDAGSFGSGTVPAGTYKVWARFGAREVSAGSVRVTAGERITLKCDADFEMCGR